MRLPVLLIAAALAAIPLAGCIQNVSDLRDRFASKSESSGEPVEKTAKLPADVSTNASKNTTRRELHNPVARMTIFGDNGALVFRASFVAEDQTSEAVPAKEGNFTLISTESEALSTGATLVKWAWEVDKKVIGSERKATATITEPGMHMIKLTVTDSDGRSDSQMVHIFIAPVPYDVETVLTGGPLVGTNAAPTGAEAHAFEIVAENEGKAVKALKMTVMLSTGPAHDAILGVADPGGATQEVDSAGLGGGESIAFESPAAGAWSFTAGSYAGASVDHTITVVVTYVQVVEGGDGHAHAH